MSAWALVVGLALTACLAWANPDEVGRPRRQRLTGTQMIAYPPGPFTPGGATNYVRATLDLVTYDDDGDVLRGVYRCREYDETSHLCLGPRATIDPAHLSSLGACGWDLTCGSELNLTLRFSDGQTCLLTTTVPFTVASKYPAISGPYYCTDAAGNEVMRGFMGLAPTATVRALAPPTGQCVGNCGQY